MAKALYVVIFSRQAWWVDLQGTAQGPYPSLQDATEEGRQLARFCVYAGRPAEVLIPDERRPLSRRLGQRQRAPCRQRPDLGGLEPSAR